MDKDILEFKGQVKKLKNDAKSILSNYKREGFENQKVYSRIEHFSQAINELVRDIEYFELSFNEFELKIGENGRYIYKGNDLTSSDSLELLIDEEWCVGRIEYAHGEEQGYYFYNYDGSNVMLKEGMLARKR